MKLLLPLLLLLPCLLQAQDSAPARYFDLAHTDFKDAVVKNNQLWSLSTEGKIVVYDLNTNAITRTFTDSFTAIGKDRHETIWAANGYSALFTFSQETGWQHNRNIGARNVYGFCFDKKDRLFVITDKGILNTENDMMYFPNYTNPFFLMKGQSFKPTCFYIDHKNNIWLGFNWGEFGGAMFIFSTAKNRFLPLPDSSRFYIFHPKSIFNDHKKIFVTNNSGVVNTGEIAAVKNRKIRPVLQCPDPESKPVMDSSGFGLGFPDALEIGAGCFDKDNRRILFYSDKGLYAFPYQKQKSAFEDLQLILKPQIILNNKPTENGDFYIYVLKMFYKEGKVFFVTSDNGIGIYDGKELRMFR